MSARNVDSMIVIQGLFTKSRSLLRNIRTLLYTQFNEDSKCKVEDDVKGLLQDYCYYIILAQRCEQVALIGTDVIDEVMNDIFGDCRKLRKIFERQKVIDELQLIKQMLFQVSESDTCKTFIIDRQKKALELNSNILANKDLKTCCSDILDELNDIIERIKKVCKNVKVQIGMEAASGVLTLGTSVVTGAVGIASVVARAGGAVACGNASAASGAAIGVGKTAKATTAAVDALDAVGAAARNIPIPALKSVAIAISSSKEVKLALKVSQFICALVNAAMKAKGIIPGTKFRSFENIENNFQAPSEELLFSVTNMYIPEYIEDFRVYASSLASSTFESLMNIEELEGNNENLGQNNE